MRTLYNFLKKRPEILALHRTCMDDRKHYSGDSLLLVEDFGEWGGVKGLGVKGGSLRKDCV